MLEVAAFFVTAEIRHGNCVEQRQDVDLYELEVGDGREMLPLDERDRPLKGFDVLVLKALVSTEKVAALEAMDGDAYA